MTGWRGGAQAAGVDAARLETHVKFCGKSVGTIRKWEEAAQQYDAREQQKRQLAQLELAAKEARRVAEKDALAAREAAAAALREQRARAAADKAKEAMEKIKARCRCALAPACYLWRPGSKHPTCNGLTNCVFSLTQEANAVSAGKAEDGGGGDKAGRAKGKGKKRKQGDAQEDDEARITGTGQALGQALGRCVCTAAL